MPHLHYPPVISRLYIVFGLLFGHKQEMSALNYDETVIDGIRRRLDRPIALIGMMGVGKTRFGRVLAQSLQLDFVDSDQEIEKAAGMEVAEIFERFGEPYFRDGEHRVLERLLRSGVKVVATGGGAVMNEQTADILWNEALTIWIRAD